MGILGKVLKPMGVGYVLMIAAGTSDLYCAEETAVGDKECDGDDRG